MGSTVHHAGPVGSATAIKLSVNALFAVQVATLAEMLALLGRNGLDAARAVEIIASTPVCSPTTRAAAAAMQAQNYAPMFPVDLAEKDLGTVLAQAALDGVPVPMAEAVRRVFARAVQQGYGADNITGVARLYTPHTA